MAELFIMDADYQQRLLKDFKERKVHPSIEQMMWYYARGKPKETVAVEGQLALDVTHVRESLSSRLASLAERLRARSVAVEPQ